MSIYGNHKSNGEAIRGGNVPKPAPTSTSRGKTSPPTGSKPVTGQQPVKVPVSGKIATGEGPVLGRGNLSNGTARSSVNESGITALSGGMAGRGTQPSSSPKDIGVHTKNIYGKGKPKTA